MLTAFIASWQNISGLEEDRRDKGAPCSVCDIVYQELPPIPSTGRNFFLLTHSPVAPQISAYFLRLFSGGCYINCNLQYFCLLIFFPPSSFSHLRSNKLQLLYGIYFSIILKNIQPDSLGSRRPKARLRRIL